MVDLIEPTELPDAPLSPLSPQAPVSPTAPEAGSFLDVESDDLKTINTETEGEVDFFTDLLIKSRRKRYEKELEVQAAQANQIFGQDGITVTDTKKFINAMEDLEGLQELAERGLGYVDKAYAKYLQYKFDVSFEQAELMSSYFQSGSYVPGVSPEDLKFFPGYKTSLAGGSGLAGDVAYTDAVVSAPLPPLKAEPLTGPMTEAQNAMNEAAKVGGNVSDFKQAGKDALVKSEKAIATGVKVASVAAAMLTINEFIKNPSIGSALGAGAATAQAAASFGVSGAKAATAALGPAALAFAGFQLVGSLISDRNYMRSQGSFNFNPTTGKFTSSMAMGADNGSSAWIEGQQAVILRTIDELTDKYGFEIDAAGVSKALKGGHMGKGYITNSVAYAKQGGRNASFSAQDYVFNLISNGGLKAGENTNFEITSDPAAFIKFMGELNTKMQDQYASYMWQNHNGLELSISKSMTNRKGYKGYVAFGSEKAAKAQASVLTKKAGNLAPITSGGSRNLPKGLIATPKMEYVVRRRTNSLHERSQVALGEFEVVPQITVTYTDKFGNPLTKYAKEYAKTSVAVNLRRRGIDI
mgnify:CR=1 FL=1|tara:strand:+ start:1050 stop:2798 length:1749 start_codon:yes stop_codon:yes gene_type:complete